MTVFDIKNKKNYILLAAACIILAVIGFAVTGQRDKNTIDIVSTNEEPKIIAVHIKGAVNMPGYMELPVGSRINDAVIKADGIMSEADMEYVNLAQVLEDGQEILIPFKEIIEDTEDANEDIIEATSEKNYGNASESNNGGKSVNGGEETVRTVSSGSNSSNASNSTNASSNTGSTANKNTPTPAEANGSNAGTSTNSGSSSSTTQNSGSKSQSIANTASKSTPAKVSDTNKKVNINKADSEELQTLPGIGEAYAARIIEYRKNNGGFKNIEEIMEVSGIAQKRFDALKDYITVG